MQYDYITSSLTTTTDSVSLDTTILSVKINNVRFQNVKKDTQKNASGTGILKDVNLVIVHINMWKKRLNRWHWQNSSENIGSWRTTKS